MFTRVSKREVAVELEVGGREHVVLFFGLGSGDGAHVHLVVAVNVVRVGRARVGTEGSDGAQLHGAVAVD